VGNILAGLIHRIHGTPHRFVSEHATLAIKAGVIVRVPSMSKLRQGWGALDRNTRIAHGGLLVLLAGAVGVRAWLMTAYAPAFLGFPDSWQYALAAFYGVFSNAQHPAGYPLFLDLIHLVSDNLAFTILLQHASGIAVGVLLYASVRRTAAPPWLGLIPAAVAFFGATGLILEHSLLSDPLMSFLQALGVYFTVRALYSHSLRWPLLAGIAIGLSFWVRTVAISSAFLVPPLLLIAAPGGPRRRMLSAGTTSLAMIALIALYVGVQDASTGFLGYQREGAWNLYGKVATFVNCADFTPPSGTGFLCPPQPLGRRQAEAYYQYVRTSPAVERFGTAGNETPHANAALQRFSIAVIEQEPVAYLKAIARGLGFYIFPRSGEGYTPQSLRAEVMSEENEKIDQPAFALLYSHKESQGYSGSTAISPLSTYESLTLIQGPVLIAVLVLATTGLFFLPRAERWAASFLTLTALLSITFAVAGNSYDARYAYPTFGPLAAGAALGAWGIGRYAARVIRQLPAGGRLTPRFPNRLR
jgi:hypothetical protein